jgi:hypothetical protein
MVHLQLSGPEAIRLSWQAAQPDSTAAIVHGCEGFFVMESARRSNLWASALPWWPETTGLSEACSRMHPICSALQTVQRAAYGAGGELLSCQIL